MEDDKDDIQERDTKRPRVSSGTTSSRPGLRDPDVLVVVGGKEFWECSLFLRSVSDYFEAAFQSGMSESIEKRFTFPDKDPDEWELVMSLLKPLANKKIRSSNWEVCLPWFEELCITVGLRKCDNYVLDKLNEISLPLECCNSVGSFMKYFEASFRYNLPASRDIAEELMEDILDEEPQLLSRDHWVFICAVLRDNEETRKNLWTSLSCNLSSGFKDNREPEEMLKNDMLPELLFSVAKCDELMKDETILDCVEVSLAGLADGIYTRPRRGKAMFSKNGEYKGESCKFFLSKHQREVKIRNKDHARRVFGAEKWYIYMVKASDEGSDNPYTELYSAPISKKHKHFPPTRGWKVDAADDPRLFLNPDRRPLVEYVESKSQR